MSEPYQLSEENKRFVLENWDKMTLPELTRKTFGDPTLDGRTKQGEAIHQFLAGAGHKVKTSKQEKKPDYVLTEEQKTFVENNFKPNTKASELCKDLFPNQKIYPLSKEFKAVVDYMQHINPSQVDASDEPVDERTYKAPTMLVHVVARVNQYVTDRQFKATDLKPHETKCMKTLMSYLGTVNFVYQASQYTKRVERSLFEGSFIRYAFDKPDLTSEEIDQYISLCAEIVSGKQIDRMLTLMATQVEDYFDGDDPDKRRLGMTIVESMNVWRLRLEGSKKYQKELYDKLTESRSERMKSRMAENATVLNLVEGWKDPEKRKQMIEIAEKEKEKDLKVFDELTSMDDVTLLIAGMTREDMEH